MNPPEPVVPQVGVAATRKGPVTIAVLTDVHDGVRGVLPARRSDIACILLQRAVHRLNRLIRPDVTVVLGDLVDDATSPATGERLAALRAILDKLSSPWIAIPGNHDGDAGRFYRVFDRPADIIDVAGVRLLPFIDPEMPGYNARRPTAGVARFRQARADFDRPLVALQHVCLSPPGQTDAPYNYTNAAEIIEAMRHAGVALSISGHHHAGAVPVRNEITTFVTAPALCEAPFRFLTVTLSGEAVTVEEHQLAMPRELGLVDMHVHTQLAYCSDNMDVETALALAQDFGLAGLGFSEHSGHLYFPARDYWEGRAVQVGVAGARVEHNRFAAYLDLKEQYARPGVSFGVEADCAFGGDLLLRHGDRGAVDHVLGSIHRTPSLAKPAPPVEVLEREVMALLEKLLAHRIDILAHPFRIFQHAGYAAPTHLFHPVAALLRQHGVAAEINYHINTPPPDFVRVCLEMGVKFSFGSDAHSLYEIGEFADHLKLLEEAGAGGRLSEVLVTRELAW